MPALYDRIGTSYQATRRADPGIVATLARLLVLRPSDVLLDIGCGSGNYTRSLAARGGHWSALDVSPSMLDQARQAGGPAIDWCGGDALALPYADDRFDAAMCTLAIHHFARLEPAFAEARRVLRSGGRFVIFTAFAEQMRHYWLNHYFPRMLARSAAQMPRRGAVLGALRSAGFDEPQVLPFEVRDTLQDLFLYAGKQRPTLYLDAAVRANISSFANLGDADELRRGLHALHADIESGRFGSIAARFAADDRGDARGDYAFVAARKP